MFLAVTSRRKRKPDPPPLLVELFERLLGSERSDYQEFPFSYKIVRRDAYSVYHVYCTLPNDTLLSLRRVTAEASEALDPASVEPLSFKRLIEVLTQLAAIQLGGSWAGNRVEALSELVAYEAIGLSRFLALAKDRKVTEFFVDSDSTPLYLDHIEAGRCESSILLTDRERQAIETHADTFSGYTLDYRTPSLKNDLEVSGARLRVSLDLEPIAVNRFALDVRRLSISSLTLPQLITLNVVSPDAAALLVAWLASGGNITIVGETGTGKTTLLNAIDEQVEPKLRRLYIEDAVETLDMLARGYHQMKIKVDPFERGEVFNRTKESEIVKALHRSPDLVMLSEIQSQEHSRAFFHALAAGAKGVQTFHASTLEQAIRRWVDIHGVKERSLLDLGLLVQMTRPDRLKPGRFVTRICQVISDAGTPRLRDIYARDRDYRLLRVADQGWSTLPAGVSQEDFSRKQTRALAKLDARGGKMP